MDGYLIPTFYGILLVSEDGKLIDKKVFSKKVFDTADKMLKINRGESIKELSTVVVKAEEKGITRIIVEDEVLARIIREFSDFPVGVESPTLAGIYVRSHHYQLAKNCNYRMPADEFVKQNREIAIHLLRSQIQLTSERKDNLVIQSVQALDEINRTINLFASRLREWYGIYFPEITRYFTDHETLTKFIVQVDDKKELTAEYLVNELHIGEERASKIALAASGSIGADLKSPDLKQIQAVANQMLELFNQRRELETYIETTVSEVALNLSGIVGPIITARLISLAGSLERLAKMPSSTIQVLGAEKALFRSKMTGARPPKHGILFQHMMVHSAKRWQRGKISRVIAGKLSIAARLDAYSTKDNTVALKEGVEKRVNEIKTKYAIAPPRQPRKQTEPRRPYQKSRYPQRDRESPYKRKTRRRSPKR